jgi:paraquat-inducible protein A
MLHGTIVPNEFAKVTVAFNRIVNSATINSRLFFHGENLSAVKACHCCGLIHNIPKLDQREKAVCTRCGSAFSAPGNLEHSASRTAAAALGAFVLFWPAVLLPILRIEQLGLENESSILSGVVELFHHGSYLVGSVVFLFSIVLPLTKIVLLLELSMLELLHRKHKAFTLRLMENLGKWSMMDVMLLAFLVMLVKLGDMVEFQFGPAILAFICCVTMSMIASISFDPHAIWEEIENEQA